VKAHDMNTMAAKELNTHLSSVCLIVQVAYLVAMSIENVFRENRRCYKTECYCLI